MFTIPEFDIALQFRSGHGYLPVKVEGFWSEPVEIRVSRNWDGEWEAKVSHSSGGHEGSQKFPAGPLVAERNFAQAILASVDVAESIMLHKDILEKSYQENVAEMEAVRAQEQAEKEAALAKDPGFSKADAELIVQEMLTDATKNARSTPKRFYMRASDKTVTFMCEKWDVKAVFKQYNGGYNSRIARKDLVEYLVNGCSSTREVVVK